MSLIEGSHEDSLAMVYGMKVEHVAGGGSYACNAYRIILNVEYL